MLAGEPLYELEPDDGSAPDQTQGNGEPVKVALRNRRTAHCAGHAAAEHLGKATALALVQQNQQGQEESSDDQQHLQPDLYGIHGS